ncbi:MAG TPA: hypothetical protein VGL02_21150 [Streptomyces sp.]
MAEQAVGLTADSPQSGAIRLVDAQAAGTEWPIRIRAWVTSDQWPSRRVWEAEFEPGDLLRGETAEGNASALATTVLVLILEYLATGPVAGIREITQP